MAHDHTRKIVLNALVVILRGVADLKTLAWCEHLTIQLINLKKHTVVSRIRRVHTLTLSHTTWD